MKAKQNPVFNVFYKIFKLKLHISALFHFKLDEGFRL